MFIGRVNTTDPTGSAVKDALPYKDVLDEYRETFQVIASSDRRAMQAIVLRLWRGWQWGRVAREMGISARRAPDVLERGRAIFRERFNEATGRWVIEVVRRMG